MKWYIITGASRGLGEALLYEIAAPDTAVIALSRKINTQAQEYCLSKSCSIQWVEADLSRPEKLETQLSPVFQAIRAEKGDQVCLINNAAQLQPSGEITRTDSTALIQGMQVNLIAPFILTQLLLKNVYKKGVKTLIVNISSHAAVKPRRNWLSYGLAKNGLNYITQAVHTEFQDKADLNIISYYPGIMNTDMRRENLKLRPLWKKILDWFLLHVMKKETAPVLTPAQAARRLASTISQENLPRGAIIDGGN